jgi:hypothetical protein
VQPRNRKAELQLDIQKAKKSLNKQTKKDYHFMMRVELHKKLRNLATDREITVSDLFEEIAYWYLKEIGKL